MLTGWAIELGRPKRKVRLTLVIEGVSLGEAASTTRRRDVPLHSSRTVPGFRIDLGDFDNPPAHEIVRTLRTLPDRHLDQPCDLKLVLGSGSSALEMNDVTRRDLLRHLEDVLKMSSGPEISADIAGIADAVGSAEPSAPEYFSSAETFADPDLAANHAASWELAAREVLAADFDGLENAARSPTHKPHPDAG